MKSLQHYATPFLKLRSKKKWNWWKDEFMNEWMKRRERSKILNEWNKLMNLWMDEGKEEKEVRY